MLSVVVPLFNEKGSLPALYKSLSAVMEGIAQQYELIFVDDGSTDGSFELLREFEKKDTQIRLFSFRKNQGKTEALAIGFQKARGDYVVTLDADLQDKPTEIEKLLEKSKEGWDIVCGWRKERKDPVLKVLSSRLFNFLVSILWKLHLHDYNCGLKVYTKEAAKSLHLYGGLHRFIPLLSFQQGFSVTEVSVAHRKRKYGKSKFGLSKLWKNLPDLFTMFFLTRYRDRPLHFFGMIGGSFLLIGFSILIYLSALWFQGYSIGRRPLLLLGILLVLSGFQIFFTGFLADLIISVSYRSDNNIGREKSNLLLRYASDR